MRTLSCLPCATTVALTLAPLTQGVADLQFGATADGQHLVENNFLAYVRSDLFYLDVLAGCNLVLFAAGFYDRVHICPFVETVATRKNCASKPADRSLQPPSAGACRPGGIGPSPHCKTPGNRAISGDQPINIA